MNKTKKINKLGLVLTLVLIMALALVVSASATMVDTFEVDQLAQNSSAVFVSWGGLSSAIVSDGYTIYENDVFEYDGSKPYYKTYIVSNIDAFQSEWNGYSYFDFNELMADTFHYYGIAEYQYNYLMSWAPPVSQEQFDRLAQEYSTLEQTYKQLVISYNTLQGEYNTLQDYNNTLQSNYNTLINDFNALRVDNETLQGEYNTLQGEYNTLQGEYNTLQGEYNTLQGEYNTLNESISRIRAESRQIGYNEGMRDADAVERGVMSIVGSPMYILTSVFDVEIFGINLLTLITTIMTVIIIAWVIKKLAN